MARPFDRAEVAVVVLLGYGAFVVPELVVVAMGGWEARWTITDAQLVRTLIAELVIGGLLALYLARRGWRVADLGVRADLEGSLVGVFLFACATLAYWLVAGIGMALDPDAVRAFRPDGELGIGWVLAASLLHPCFEESLHLAYVQERFRSSGPGIAIGVSLGLRLAVHVYQGPTAVLGIVPLGLVLGVYHWRTRKLWPVIVAHVIGDLVGLGAHVA